MDTNVVLIPNEEGGTLLGISTPLGVIPIISFSSFDELRRFAMGMLGFCELFCPEVPKIFIQAFEKEG